MDITALFDDSDSAEHALINLQALGIFPTRYKIRALHISEDTGRSKVALGNTAIPGGAYMRGDTASPGFGIIGLSGEPLFGSGEPPNREVQLLVTVEETEAHRTQSALISNRGRRVRILS